MSELPVEARIETPVPPCSGLLVGANTVAAWTTNQPAEVIVVEWDEDAQRPTIPTRPLRVKAPPPPVLEASGRTSITKRLYKDQRVDSISISDTTFTRCKFDVCTLGYDRATEGKRIVIRGVEAVRCMFRSILVAHVAFESCLLDAPTITKGATLTGCTFNRVVLRGKLGRIDIEPWASRHGTDTPEMRRLDQKLADHYRDVAWALDIREADATNLFIDTVPLHLVRRDPERQLLPRIELVSHPAWQSPTVTEAFYVFDLARDVQREGSVFLIHANETTGRAARSAALHELRAAGVLDEVTGVVGSW